MTPQRLLRMREFERVIDGIASVRASVRRMLLSIASSSSTYSITKSSTSGSIGRS